MRSFLPLLATLLATSLASCRTTQPPLPISRLDAVPSALVPPQVLALAPGQSLPIINSQAGVMETYTRRDSGAVEPLFVRVIEPLPGHVSVAPCPPALFSFQKTKVVDRSTTTSDSYNKEKDHSTVKYKQDQSQNLTYRSKEKQDNDATTKTKLDVPAPGWPWYVWALVGAGGALALRQGLPLLRRLV